MQIEKAFRQIAACRKRTAAIIFGITTLLFHFHLSYNNIIFALKKISDMDKRIRLVWVLSIITMLALFCGQTYWLYNQFVYSNDENISKLEKVCAKSLKKEFMLREAYKERHRKKGKEAVWGDDSYANSMALNVQITYLRRALRSDSSVVIDAIIKKGYVLKCGL
jgi:hypothetical protein